MKTIPDSNVLLDLMYGAGPEMDWSARWLQQVAAGGLVTDAIVFSEITARVPDFAKAMALLEAFGLDYEPVPELAAHAAGIAHVQYRARGGQRSRTLPDFLIGAHAAVKGYRILTRDAGRYRDYFPNVTVIAPDSHP